MIPNKLPGNFVQLNQWRAILKYLSITIILMSLVYNVQCQTAATPLQSIAEAKQRLDAGRKLWQKTSEGKGKDYFYWLQDFSNMGQRVRITGLQVEAGKVSLRAFKTFSRNQNGQVLELQAWQESQPGSRGNKHAQPARTMEELYQSCLQDVIPQARHVQEIQLKMDQEGALQTCLVTPSNCQDDCSKGYSLGGIQYKVLNDSEKKIFLSEAYPEFLK